MEMLTLKKIKLILNLNELKIDDLESESVSGNINDWRSFNIEFDFKNQKLLMLERIALSILITYLRV